MAVQKIWDGTQWVAIGPNAAHTHDDRYYTEAEVDGFLADKSATSHIHDDRYYTEAEIDAAHYTKTEVDAKTTSLPRCSGSISVNHSLNNNWTLIAGYTQDYDNPGDMLDPVSGKVTIPASGVYALTAGIVYNTSASGRRVTVIERGTATVGTNPTLARVETPTSGYVGHNLSREVWCNAGDVLTFCTYQTTGAALNAMGTFNPTYFTVRKVQ